MDSLRGDSQGPDSEVESSSMEDSPSCPPHSTLGCEGLEEGRGQMYDLTVTSMLAGKKDKVCLVCGDRALGYNFNAISCESCKAFFRRNAHKNIRGRCEGKCVVTTESRSFCKRCRLAKCFAVGMRKDMILNEEQRKMRKQKIILNKLRRQGQMPPEDTYSASPQDVLSPKGLQSPPITSPESLASASPSPSSSVDSGHPHFRLDPSFKVKQEPGLGGACPTSGGGPSLRGKSWSESVKLGQEAIARMSEPHRAVLQELLTAYDLSNFLANTTTSLKALPSNTTQFINVAEGCVRRIIQVSKKVELFMKLQKDDQIALLKGSVVDIMMLRSAVNYDPFTETWSLDTKGCLQGPGPGSSSPEGGERLSADLLKMGSQESRNMFMTYSKFIKALMNTIRGDLVILKLLIIISLFSADRVTLQDRDLVQSTQEKYAEILRQYVASRFPEEKSLFARAVMKLTDLRNINEVHTKMLLKMSVDDIEPLLIEIFDLPNE